MNKSEDQMLTVALQPLAVWVEQWDVRTATLQKSGRRKEGGVENVLSA